MARIELIQGSAQQLVAARATGRILADALPQRRGQLRHMAAANGEPPLEARIARTRLERVQSRFHAPQSMMNRRIEALRDAVDVRKEFVLPPDDDLSRRRRRRSAQVG